MRLEGRDEGRSAAKAGTIPRLAAPHPGLVRDAPGPAPPALGGSGSCAAHRSRPGAGAGRGLELRRGSTLDLEPESTATLGRGFAQSGLAAVASSHDGIAQRFRLSDERAARILERLDRTADLVDALGETEHLFELPGPGSAPLARARLRYAVGQDFGELQLETDADEWGPAVFAAGPIERILAGIGFREVSRRFVVARRYALQAARIRVAHVAPIGWFCEIVPPEGVDVRAIVAALGQSADTLTAERRVAERRDGDRRRAGLNSPVERRARAERRVGDRRLVSLS